jgi:hypothetical protein
MAKTRAAFAVRTFWPSFPHDRGQGTCSPGNPAFAGALCLALVDGTEAALRSAAEIARRADQLLAVAPKLRTKGAEPVIRSLLNQDAVLASAPGANLSRWASTRMFDRLQSFGPCANSQGDRLSGFTGYDDDTGQFRKGIPKQRTTSERPMVKRTLV